MEYYVSNREDRRKYVKRINKLDEKISAMEKTVLKLKKERKSLKETLNPIKQ